ncbi:MAG: IS3 family transposase [Bacteroidales bacterium]|nr:IS3 family transposase [Candidatus Latescibacterota bacterium]
MAEYLVAEKKLSIRKACGAVGQSRSAWYRPLVDKLARDREVIDALQELMEDNIRWGFWKCFDRIRLDGHRWNHKRIYRVYKELGLNQRRKTKKRLPVRTHETLEVPAEPNAVWSIEFMHDTLYIGRRFRTFNVLDEGVREILDIEIDTSLSGERIVRVLERIKSWRGLPASAPQLLERTPGALFHTDWSGDAGEDVAMLHDSAEGDMTVSVFSPAGPP